MEEIISLIVSFLLIFIFIVACIIDLKERKRKKQLEWNEFCFKKSLLEKLDNIANSLRSDQDE